MLALCDDIAAQLTTPFPVQYPSRNYQRSRQPGRSINGSPPDLGFGKDFLPVGFKVGFAYPVRAL
jgi:hypothetical protein